MNKQELIKKYEDELKDVQKIFLGIKCKGIEVKEVKE